MKRITGSTATAASLAALVAWLWNGYVDDPKMTVEVAGAMGGFIGPIVAYLVSWLPRPQAEG